MALSIRARDQADHIVRHDLLDHDFCFRHSEFTTVKIRMPIFFGET